MTGNTIEFISILVTVTGLLGWVIKRVIDFFIKQVTDNKIYLESLVTINQKNTENFVNTINHQRTLDREMQGRNVDAILNLTTELSNTNKINSTLIEIFKDGKTR